MDAVGTAWARWSPGVSLVCAVAAPFVVLAGAGYAASVQPPGYDPMRQTFSALANAGATDGWIMGATLLVLGLGYLLTAAGLPGIGRGARVVLAVGGAGVAMAALCPQPATGTNPWHMGSAAVGWLAFTAWPLAVSRARDDGGDDRGGTPAVLRRGPAWAATAVLVGLMAWFGLELLLGGDRLGLAQRVLVVAQTLWPMAVALAAFRRRWGTARPPDLRRAGTAVFWVVVLAPAVIPIGSTVAAAVQPPGYDPLRQSLSTLARIGATDRWIMTGTLVLLGLGYVAGALVLTRIPWPGRVAVGLGGAGTLFAGLLPQPETGSSPWHMGAATVGWIAFVGFPLAASRHPSASPLLGRRAAWVVTGTLLALLGWFFVQLQTGGPYIGLSERVLIIAQTLWPAVVVAALRRDHLRGDHPRRSTNGSSGDAVSSGTASARTSPSWTR
ncbi:MAG: DUF998 domain-containing protein [Pseudonocardia sediminis]